MDTLVLNSHDTDPVTDPIIPKIEHHSHVSLPLSLTTNTSNIANSSSNHLLSHDNLQNATIGDISSNEIASNNLLQQFQSPKLEYQSPVSSSHGNNTTTGSINSPNDTKTSRVTQIDKEQYHTILAQLYEKHKYPQNRDLEEVAHEAGTTVKKIRQWFQSQRNKERKSNNLVGSGKRLGEDPKKNNENNSLDHIDEASNSSNSNSLFTQENSNSLDGPLPHSGYSLPNSGIDHLSFTHNDLQGRLSFQQNTIKTSVQHLSRQNSSSDTYNQNGFDSPHMGQLSHGNHELNEMQVNLNDVSNENYSQFDQVYNHNTTHNNGRSPPSFKRQNNNHYISQKHQLQPQLATFFSSSKNNIISSNNNNNNGAKHNKNITNSSNSTTLHNSQEDPFDTSPFDSFSNTFDKKEDLRLPNSRSSTKNENRPPNLQLNPATPTFNNTYTPPQTAPAHFKYLNDSNNSLSPSNSTNRSHCPSDSCFDFIFNNQPLPSSDSFTVSSDVDYNNRSDFSNLQVPFTRAADIDLNAIDSYYEQVRRHSSS